MNPQRTLAAALVLAVALPALMSLVTGCQESPPEPVFDNPFDPASPAGGDALNIRAFYGGGVVSVLWDHLDGHNIDIYDVDRSLGDQSSWEPLVFDLPAPTSSWVDSTAVPNVIHYYQVQAKTEDGTFTVSSYIVPASIETPPFLALDPPGSGRPSRYLDLRIVAGQGDSLRIADNIGFSNADTHLAAAAGEVLAVVWDAGPQAANGDSIYVYVQTFSNGYGSVADTLKLVADFAPPFTAEGTSAAGTVANRDLVLLIPEDGVQTMRFAASKAGLDIATPVPGAPTYPYLLADTADTQSVWGRFDGDFGFSSDVRLLVQPDLLEDASFELDLPDNGVISRPQVTVLSDAVATEMRFTDNNDFSGISWEPYSASRLLSFTPTPGQVVIHGEYRNDWTNTQSVLPDTLTYVLVPLSITFDTPQPDEILAGDEIYTLTGRAIVADGGSLDAVDLELGNGIWVHPITQQNWTFDWDVPLFRADKGLVLRARAVSGTDVVTTHVNVVVTQLAVAVVEPAPDEYLDPDAAVTIAGTATPPKDGSVDSVTVDVGGEHFLVPDVTTDWSVNNWSTPVVSEPTSMVITAAAWANGDSVQTTVNVVITELGVAIAEPTPDQTLAPESSVTIAGTATRSADSAVDSVTVVIDGKPQQVTGTTDWSVDNWFTPTVTSPTPLTITAAAWADGDSVRTSVNVTVDPSAR